jgi:hypothetical protein
MPDLPVWERLRLARRVLLLGAGGGYDFLGGVPLSVALSEQGIAYKDALTFIEEGQQEQRGTHVHRVVAAAMDGQFGSAAPHVWISPLSAIQWYFDARVMAASHLFLQHLEGTETIWDVTNLIRSCRKNLDVRSPTMIPL